MNVDPREADPARLSVDEFQSAVTRLKDAGGVETRGEAQEQEDRQHLWRYALAAMAVLLAAEGMLAAQDCYELELRTQNLESRMQPYDEIRELIDRVRARWRALVALQALVRGALVAALIVGVALLAARWTDGAPVALMALAAVAVLLAAAALVWCLAPLRRVPADGQVARFIEERSPSLGDRLVTAVDVAQAPNRAGARRA